MKTYLFLLLAVFSGLMVSCGSEDKAPPCNDITMPFRYSIILKDKDGRVLSGGDIPFQYAIYWEEDIRLIPYPEDSYADPFFALRKYEKEHRIAITAEFNECRQGCLEMILELIEIRHNYGSMMHKYPCDTIRCDLKVVNDSLVCEKISVNEILSWENDGITQEEPCITLVKNIHMVTAWVRLED
ncbi:MAG: hypothetical protein LBG96_15395 [Tannerella sp.]|jgi:hypothetical protein|nr:hypothetical protein [Tannerella sp.]